MPNPRFTPLEAENLAPTDDLRPYVYDEIRVASDNQITDFSPHSPIVALVEGLDFRCRELQYFINRYASNVAIEHLKIAGIQRRLGSKAVVTLTFTLTASLSTPFILSSGYLVSTLSGIEFLTDSTLIIPAGSTTGTITATAIQEGLEGNVGEGTITNLSVARAYLQGVTNLEPASGGLGEETLSEVLSRGFQALRYREVLITADDFETEAVRILGFGSVAKAVGNLSSDKVTLERGAVHLFVLNPDGSEPNEAQLSNLKMMMDTKIPTFLTSSDRTTSTIITSGLYVSPLETVALSLNVIVAMFSGDNPTNRANTISDELEKYINPLNLRLGSTLILKEVENVVRSCGINYVQSVSIANGSDISYGDYIPPNDYTSFTLSALKVKLIDPFNQVFEYNFTYAA